MKKSIIEFINVLSSKYDKYKKGEIYIVTIAIDDYDSELKLNHSIRDSEYLIDVCSKKSFIEIKKKNIYKLYNKNATKKNIISQFRKINNILTPKDQLIIHIAGHSNISIKTNFFVPVDGSKDDIYSNITNSYFKEFINRTSYSNCIVILNTFNETNKLKEKTVEIPDTNEINSKLSLFTDLIQFLKISETHVNKSIWHYANTEKNQTHSKDSYVIVEDTSELTEYLKITKNKLDKYIENGEYADALKNIIKISRNNDNKVKDQADSLLNYLITKSESHELVKPISPVEAKGLTSNLVHQVHESGYYLIPKSNFLAEDKEKSKTKIILYTSADTADQVRLRLDEEYREINLQLLRSKFRDDFELVPCLSSRISDLQRELLDKEPYIVHFTGHGSCKGICMVADDLGNTQLIKNKPLSGLFRLFSDKINCVFLNSCHSESQSKAISDNIDHVICMSSSILDDTAIKFASSFYMALGSGKDISFSFEFAKNSIDLHGCEDNDLPTLVKKE